MRYINFASVTIAAALVISGTAAVAAPKPMDLAPTYDDAVGSDLKLEKNPKSCAITIGSLTDERRSPEMVGVFFGRAVRAPADRDAWLRSIIDGLQSRKIAVIPASTAENAQGTARVDIAITKAWVTNTASNMSASIVFRVKPNHPAEASEEKSFRGGASHSSFFSGGPGELQRAFNTAVSRGLDAMASDFHKTCGNAVL